MKSLLFFLPLLAACQCAPAQLPPPMEASDAAPLEPEPAEGTPVNVTVHVDTSCGVLERTAMHKAADIWRSQTGQLANIRLVHDLDYDSVVNVYGHEYNGDNTLSCVGEDSALTKEQDSDHGATLLGWVNPGGGIHNVFKSPAHIFIVPDRSAGHGANYRTSLYLHEFGHFLGLPHDETFDTIMFKTTYDGKTTCLKKSDLAAYCRYNDCGITQTFPCE